MSEFNFVSSGSKMEEISEEAKVECMYRYGMSSYNLLIPTMLNESGHGNDS